MIDHDDVDFAILASDLSGPIIGAISIIGIAILLYFSYRNEQECSAMKCENGYEARLLDNDCLCVAKAVK